MSDPISRRSFTTLTAGLALAGIALILGIYVLARRLGGTPLLAAS